jgi:hypothetical protein
MGLGWMVRMWKILLLGERGGRREGECVCGSRRCRGFAVATAWKKGFGKTHRVCFLLAIVECEGRNWSYRAESS